MKLLPMALTPLALGLPIGAVPPSAVQDPKKQGVPEDYADADPASLGVDPYPAKEDPRTGFVVGGKNSTASIRSLKEINGRTIAELDKDMRAGADSEVGSTKGFLGKDEALLDVLAADDDFVVETSKSSHRELARHMHMLGAVGVKLGEKEFLYQGRRFRVKTRTWRGDQLSPFRDGTKTNADVVVRNLDAGKEVGYSLRVPFMVEHYGFYEGHGTPYRFDPGKLLEVFDFLGKPTKP